MDEGPPEYVPWEDVDFRQRNPAEKFKHLKDLEDMALSIQRDNLKVIVVCAGIQYGKGEQIFQKHFKVSEFVLLVESLAAVTLQAQLLRKRPQQGPNHTH